MTIASTRLAAALPALLSPWLVAGLAGAVDRAETVASVTITRSAAVTVVSNAPLQTLLLTTAIAPVGVVFAAPATGTVGSPGGGGGTPIGNTANGASPAGAAPAPAAASEVDADSGDGAVVVGLASTDGGLTGTTINGDAVSVSVGNMDGGSAPTSGRVSVIIAQYN